MKLVRKKKPVLEYKTVPNILEKSLDMHQNINKKNNAVKKNLPK